MPKMLVLRRGGLGDTLLMLPVLAALRRQCAGAELHFAGVLEFAELLPAFGAVDRACSTEALQLWALARRPAAAAVVARFGSYQHIVADDPAVAVLAAADRQVQVFDPRRVRPGSPFGAQLLEQLGLGDAAADARLAARAAPMPGAPVVLAPGSGAPAKCWPRAHWLLLAAMLAATGHRLAVVIGPAERERDDPSRWGWPDGTGLWAGLGVVELAQRLRPALAFAGNDSGVTHLAAALSVPTVALFGPTDPAVWAPAGEHVQCLREVAAGRPAADPGAVCRALLALAESGRG